MLEAIVSALTLGDIHALKSKMLHSTSWLQHHAKAYGEDKHNKIILQWLSLAGQCRVDTSSVITQGLQQVVHLKLTPANAKHSISYTLWLETNGKHIKSIDAVVDTIQLKNTTSHTFKDLLASLPRPDAFVLLDYDQQDHLQNELASPSNIASMTQPIARLLDKWWSIWQCAQLSTIKDVYHVQAQLSLPGSDKPQTTGELFTFALQKFNLLTRPFAQLEKLVVANNKVAIKWHLDGDEQYGRIRVPFVTLLTLEGDKIIADHTSCDIVAHQKRFEHSSLFLNTLDINRNNQ